MERMGTTCSSQRHQRTWSGPLNRRRKETDQSNERNRADESSMYHSSLRHSVVSAIPDEMIADLFPPEENYVLDTYGRRSPKSLAQLATETICRSLPDMNGELPPGIPEDAVDDIIRCLIGHSAVNATTLRALRHCELGILSLANCRGVRDEWLEPLSSRTPPSPSLMALSHASDGIESMDLDDTPREEDFGNHVPLKGEECSCSTASFISASSSPYAILPAKSEDSMETAVGDRDSQQHKDIFKSCEGVFPPTFVTTNITLLDLRGSQHLTDRGLLHLNELNCLEVARLDNCHSIQGSGLLAFAMSNRLHTLTMGNCRRLTDDAIINISHLVSIETLLLPGCRCLTDRSLDALSDLYNLTKLDISQCDLVTDGGIEMIETLENLEYLNIGWCRQISDTGLEMLTRHPGRSENLRILRLARCPITDTGIESLSRLVVLEELDLNGCSRVSSAGLGEVLPRLEKLRCLEVSYCPMITRSSWQGKINSLETLDLCYSAVRDVHLFNYHHLPSLRALSLDSCPIGDASIRHLADNGVVPNLESLDLADTDLTDIGMANIAKFTNLVHLSLFYCNISNNGLKHLSKLSKLRTLNLDSRDISDEGLRYLGNLRLTSLDIFSGRITDAGCGHISRISSLETLELCGGGVGDLGCTLLATLENLTSLNLSQNDRISNRGAAALAALTNLRSLNLSNTRVTASALRFFRNLRKLQSLAVYGCSGMEDGNGLYKFQNGLPTLKCLRLNSATEQEGRMLPIEDTRRPDIPGHEGGHWWHRRSMLQPGIDDDDDYSDHD